MKEPYLKSIYTRGFEVPQMVNNIEDITISNLSTKSIGDL